MFLRKIFYLRMVRNQQYYEDLNSLQNELFLKTIKSAFETDFYKTLYSSYNIKPEDIKSLKDISKLPFISKENIREAFEKGTITNDKVKGKISQRKTSGSTGFPLTVIFDEKSYDYSEAIYARALLEQGVNLTDKVAYFWYEKFKKRGFWEHFGIFRKNEILYTEDEDIQLKKLFDLNPDVIHCFPSLLSILAKKMQNESIVLRPKLIITHGEVLTNELRVHIEKEFGCRILDQYGSNEFNRMAWECPEEGSMHIDADSIYLEVLDENGSDVTGKKGDIVVTSLNNMKMPLIRYKIGDIGIKSQESCRCGRMFPILKELEGRDDDYIILKDKVISPRRIGGILENLEGVSQFNFHQEKTDLFRLNVVKDKNFDKEKIVKSLNKILGDNIHIEIIAHKKIQRGKTGKIQMVTSKIKKAKLV